MANDQQSFDILRAPPNLAWKDGKRIAAVFNFAYEMWSDGITSGVGPMGNVLAEGIFDPNADSYGRYNATAGIKRLIWIADSNGIATNVLTSGKVAECHPEQLLEIANAGHEIVGHGYAQNLIRPMLSEQEELADIAQSTELITKAIQKRPTGWISPRVTSGPDTHRRLARHGYRWHGDALDDDLPYLQRFPDGEILAIPMSVEFNDLPHAMRFGRTPTQFVTLFKDAIEALLASPQETIILDVFAHGHCYGRPATAWAIDKIMKYCVANDHLWVTTRDQIASSMNFSVPVDV